MDVPLTAGSVVVPADAYAWAKTLNNGLIDIAGMYREQFNGFHNVGILRVFSFKPHDTSR